MDKRFFLALVLTAAVVIATPLVFPNRSRSAAPVPARTDSARVAAESTTTTAAAAPPPTSTVPPGQDSAAAALAAAGAGAAVAETTLVETPLSAYRFSNIGATPIGATMTTYRALNGSQAPVELVRAGEALLHFTLITEQDSVSLARTPFQLTRTTDAHGAPVLEYSALVANARVAITYSFVPDSYLVKVRGAVTPTGGSAPRFMLIGLPTTIRSSEADSTDDQRHLAYAYKPQAEGAKSVPFAKVDPGERRLVAGPLTWVAAKSKYFIVGLLAPEKGTSFAELTVTGGARTSKVASVAHGTVAQPLQNGAFEFELYAGPQEWQRLLAVGRDFENSNPYGGFLQGVVQPFATIVMRILLWMKATLQLNYGWVLVIFGVAIRLLLWPLNQSAMRTSLKMQRIQPHLADLQKRYRNDPQKLQTEMMRVYKEHGMSPFSAFSGCLPMLLPMPILFALFFVFQNTIEFRGVPFLWLADISLKDPFYILPLLMGVSMYVLSWVGMRNTPPNPQTKMMTYFFPVFMTFVLLNLPAGLNLYYAVQNLAALPQQWLIANERAKVTRSS